jgi:hypothetical protein
LSGFSIFLKRALLGDAGEIKNPMTKISKTIFWFRPEEGAISSETQPKFHKFV